MEHLESVLERVRALEGKENLVSLNQEVLSKIGERVGTKTEFGNYDFCSLIRNRSAGLTVYVGSKEVMQTSPNDAQQSIIDNLDDTLDEVFDYLEKAPLHRLELNMGENGSFTPRCHLYLSAHKIDHSRLGLMAANAFFPSDGHKGPDMYQINLPEWHENKRQILVFPEIYVTIVLGSDYYGEVKKGFLRMGMYCAKMQGRLGLHAGTKMVIAKRPEGLSKIGMVIFGLTATGKTTHTCHDHGLTAEGEEIRILQDDVVFLGKDGSALGTERGFYIKTDGLDPKHQPLLHEAAMMPETILENVLVDHQGKVHFQDLTLTGNGRGIVQRDSLGRFTPETIDLPPLDEMDRMIVFFITRRNTILPIISKLTPAQAAGAFMLGESVESSGGDPRRAGESVRVVGTNPFIIGDEGAEGNWFYDFLLTNSEKVECYLLNTGGVGEIIEGGANGNKRFVRKVDRVEIEEVAAVIRGISRGTLEWKKESDFNTLVPLAVDGIDLSRLDPRKFYVEGEVARMVKTLKEERKEYLSKFPELGRDILDAYDI